MMPVIGLTVNVAFTPVPEPPLRGTAENTPALYSVPPLVKVIPPAPIGNS